MTRFLALLGKELRSLFGAPLVYFVGAVFLALSGYYFYTDLNAFITFGFGESIFEHLWQRLYNDIVRVVITVIPLVTMRIYSEEKNLGTIELLYTAPLRDIEILAAKYLACLSVFIVLLGSTALYPWMIYSIQPYDLSQLYAVYLGLFLLVCAMVAIGVFISSLTETQLIAAMFTYGAVLLLWNLSWNDFDEEAGQIDGTIAHSIERLIGISTTEIANKKLKTTYCGYQSSKQYLEEKINIEGQNRINLDGIQKVIHFAPKELEPNWSATNNIRFDSLDIHWVIPHFTPGLGGHMTIFRTIDFLERCGHRCTIWIHSELRGYNKSSRLSLLHKRLIDQHFIPLKTDQVYMLGNKQEDLDLISGDVIVATDRMSTFPVLGMKNSRSDFITFKTMSLIFSPEAAPAF